MLTTLYEKNGNIVLIMEAVVKKYKGREQFVATWRTKTFVIGENVGALATTHSWNNADDKFGQSAGPTFFVTCCNEVKSV